MLYERCEAHGGHSCCGAPGIANIRGGIILSSYVAMSPVGVRGRSWGALGGREASSNVATFVQSLQMCRYTE